MSEIRAVYLDRRIRPAEPTRGSARCAVADEIRRIMENCSESNGFGSLTIRGADDVEIVLNLMAALRLLYESREPWPEEPLVVVIPEGSLPKLMSVKDYEEHGMPEGPPDPDEDPTLPDLHGQELHVQDATTILPPVAEGEVVMPARPGYRIVITPEGGAAYFKVGESGSPEVKDALGS